jgi:hypothetical protein
MGKMQVQRLPVRHNRKLTSNPSTKNRKQRRPWLVESMHGSPRRICNDRAPQKPSLDFASADNKKPRYINSSVSGAPITETSTLSESQLELKSMLETMGPVRLSRKENK